ncbi:MAG: hypothetical protein ACI87O_001506, partial [Planctomycetota bacterium]
PSVAWNTVWGFGIEWQFSWQFFWVLVRLD